MTYQCDAACSCECSEREIARLRTELKEFCNAAADEMTRLRAENERRRPVRNETPIHTIEDEQLVAQLRIEIDRLRTELEQKDAELTNLKRDHESLVFLFNAHYGTEK